MSCSVVGTVPEDIAINTKEKYDHGEQSTIAFFLVRCAVALNSIKLIITAITNIKSWEDNLDFISLLDVPAWPNIGEFIFSWEDLAWLIFKMGTN